MHEMTQKKSMGVGLKQLPDNNPKCVDDLSCAVGNNKSLKGITLVCQ